MSRCRWPKLWRKCPCTNLSVIDRLSVGFSMFSWPLSFMFWFLCPLVRPSDLFNAMEIKYRQSILPLFRRISNDLPPTPAKFHYIFNLRDLSRIVHGMCMTVPNLIEVSINHWYCGESVKRGYILPSFPLLVFWDRLGLTILSIGRLWLWCMCKY